ncbi:cache domain-containing protein [Aquabacter spiritensis]|uniref:Cache domain-containing protein n=1 Tax=Aquabacter spiritensis TaxID=933073 RepID=A0A4R3LWQ0_9HYPH|nr:cache domain-containing protein [Aquabacter spiritensis]TCT04189.1 hypothetical protein EDC64_1074 [Aquabacter spiritensis]
MGTAFARVRRALSERGGFRTRAILIACALAPLVLFGILSWLDYDTTLRRARQDAMANAYTLAEHADQVFGAVDVALLQIEFALTDRLLTEIRTDGELHRMLSGINRRLSALESVFVVDGAGSIAASSRAFPMPPYDVQSREYFVAGKNGHDGLFFSVPFRGQFSRSIAFTASRPLQRDGAFHGLLGVTIFPEYFHSLYRGAFLPDTHAVAALMRRDGTLIFKSPEPRTGSDNATADPALVALAAGQNSGLVEGRGMLDARPSITAFRALPNVPLVMVYAVSEADVLAGWRVRFAGYGVAAACAGVLFTIGGALILARPAIPGGPPQEMRGVAERARTEGEPASRTERGADTVLSTVIAALGLARRLVPDDAPPAAGAPDARLREALEGAVHGVFTVQRLIVGTRSRAADARIVNVNSALDSLRKLLLGTMWPAIEVIEGHAERSLDVFVDPARFDLALLDLALGLNEAAPGGGHLRVEATRRAVRNGEPQGIAPGDYVAIAFWRDAGERATGESGIRIETRLRLVAQFATQSDGVMTRQERAGAVIGATLWLPAALVRRAPRKS